MKLGSFYSEISIYTKQLYFEGVQVVPSSHSQDSILSRLQFLLMSRRPLYVSPSHVHSFIFLAPPQGFSGRVQVDPSSHSQLTGLLSVRLPQLAFTSSKPEYVWPSSHVHVSMFSFSSQGLGLPRPTNVNKYLKYWGKQTAVVIIYKYLCLHQSFHHGLLWSHLHGELLFLHQNLHGLLEVLHV